jgi:hypothetical protein
MMNGPRGCIVYHVDYRTHSGKITSGLFSPRDIASNELLRGSPARHLLGSTGINIPFLALEAMREGSPAAKEFKDAQFFLTGFRQLLISCSQLSLLNVLLARRRIFQQPAQGPQTTHTHTHTHTHMGRSLPKSSAE